MHNIDLVDYYTVVDFTCYVCHRRRLHNVLLTPTGKSLDRAAPLLPSLALEQNEIEMPKYEK